ncbi:5-hydroxytryptamine receptor 1 isoform X1 [Macrosteles quadrilineatus]|uniref:5-hydroxytryptamine receptor 1 isoform X1 n=1 Tax=Macrosteles quadrilineatus TaxID=74068 RepID=UPI0023E1B7F6|nr:5-hydroxytryptamine receptor 1 isoform X1 [Macrosteles quadrilineatus]XP_054257695.1 5-hydroxytryptamine receptor 1 isoform X1 [Macrosteles quadrilineatus]
MDSYTEFSLANSTGFQTNLSETVYTTPSSLVSWFPGPSSPYTPIKALIIGFVLSCVIIVTIIGNILVCVAVCLVRKLRRPCNYLLVSLAVSDLCVAILVMPMALLYEILGRWSFGPIVCDVWVSFDVLSCTASILNLCMISVDRYYAITKPLEYGVKRTPRRMIACVTLVWLAAACISLPPLLILGNRYEGGEHCLVCQDFGYQIYATLLSFYIPLAVMIFVYYKIFRAARKIVLEERRAQSHLETSHCYLEISAKNGGGPPEAKLAANVSTGSSPAVSTPATTGKHHRTSTTSTNTTVNLNCSGGQNNAGAAPVTPSNSRCFGPRRSNESQCPMLQSASKTVRSKLRGAARRGRRGGGGEVGDPTTNGGSVAHTKKLRFQLAKERKASTTLGIIMSAFTICWLPFFVLALVRPFLSDPDAIPSSLSSLFLWLGYANSLLNPVIYATLNRDFRRPFQQILYFRCGSLNHMMREEFYHSQYGDPEPQHQYCVVGGSPDRVTEHQLADEVGPEDRKGTESFL